jgi:indole-3-glycerol phosphate synthase
MLREICTRARADVEARRRQIALARVRVSAVATSRPASLIERLKDWDGVSLIAECKQRSPSAGVLRDPYDPVALACAYERGGASAVSCLTNGPYFGGSLEHLRSVAQAISVPVLRKEFIVDPYQIWEARAAGAAAVLLIVAALGRERFHRLLESCREAELEALVEVHDRAELDVAQQEGARLIGVNNRDLHDFSVDPHRVVRLAAGVDERVVLVAESGIESAVMVASLRSTPVRAVLVGGTLVRSAAPEREARLLVKAGRDE